jgi:hypothetical protein
MAGGLVNVAERLAALTSVEAAPTIDDLGGAAALCSVIPALDERLIVRAAETLWESWETATQRAELVAALAGRVDDIDTDLEFADVADGLVHGALSGEAETVEVVGEALMRCLEPDAVSARPLRAGHALRSAVELAIASEGPFIHGLLASAAKLKVIPEQAAVAFARGLGALLDAVDEPWVRAILREQLLPIRPAAPQAAIELGYCCLRDAFAEEERAPALAAIAQAEVLFSEAARDDEQRADAGAMAAATGCVLAFADADTDRLADQLRRFERARGELAAWSWSDGASRAEAAAGAWLLLTCDLAALDQHLNYDGVARLEAPLRAMAEAYCGIRLRVITDDRFGLRSVVRARIVAEAVDNVLFAQGLRELSTDTEYLGLAAKAGEVVAALPVVPKPWARRRRPPPALRLLPSL